MGECLKAFIAWAHHRVNMEMRKYVTYDVDDLKIALPHHEMESVRIAV